MEDESDDSEPTEILKGDIFFGKNGSAKPKDSETQFNFGTPSERMLFLNVAWMKDYKGKTTSDNMQGGGSYVKEFKMGSEMFNFLNEDGYAYGYVQPAKLGDTIDIWRIGAKHEASTSVDGVLVIWVAKHPTEGGTRIVGWYKNATIYYTEQEPPPDAKRTYEGEQLSYRVKGELPAAEAAGVTWCSSPLELD
jgi:hypothetical protein